MTQPWRDISVAQWKAAVGNVRLGYKTVLSSALRILGKRVEAYDQLTKTTYEGLAPRIDLLDLIASDASRYATRKGEPTLFELQKGLHASVKRFGEKASAKAGYLRGLVKLYTKKNGRFLRDLAHPQAFRNYLEDVNWQKGLTGSAPRR
ncbi:hypothetical protein AYO40_04805 [Planctomycetaceae bacterium SCGC AG-212-D15]|nr:hypothetical protein AYO40_04805 [Planctomycetaceae bacterium SCGC AG-212-D15]